MSSADHNPYQPPSADVTPPPEERQGEFIPGGRSVPASNGISWIGKGWSLFASAPGIWILNMIILFVIFIALGLVPVIGSLASSIVTPLFFGGLALGCRSIDQGTGFNVDHLFAGFREKAGPLVLVGVISLCLTVGVLIVVLLIAFGMLGTGLFQTLSDPATQSAALAGMGLRLVVLVLIAMALFIPISMAIWFAPALVVLQNLSPVEAVVHSFKGCLRNLLAFLLYGIVILVLGIIAIIPMGLGLLILIPIAYASAYAAYCDIFAPPRGTT